MYKNIPIQNVLVVCIRTQYYEGRLAAVLERVNGNRGRPGIQRESAWVQEVVN